MNDKLHVPLVVAITVMLVSCSFEEPVELPDHVASLANVIVAKPGTEPMHNITLTRDAEYGDSEEVFLGPRISDTAVDSDGRVYIATATSVYVYNPDGSFLRQLGRAGSGPGEFGRIMKIHADTELLHVLDYNRQIISNFDIRTFNHNNDVIISLNSDDDEPSWMPWVRERRNFYQPLDFFVRTDGSYLIFFGDFTFGPVDNVDGRTLEGSIFNPQSGNYLEHDVFTFDWTGGVLVIKTNSGTGVMGDLPVKADSKIRYLNDQLIHAWSEEMLFRYYDEEGNYQHSLYIPFNRIPLDAENIVNRLPRYDPNDSETIERVKDILSNAELPEVLPVFNTFLADDENRLWVSLFTNDARMYEWWVLDRDGSQLAKFDWPIGRSVRHIQNEYLYAQELDEDGLVQLVRYRIDLR